jgi:hypothetical protein
MRPNISNASFVVILIVMNLMLAFYATPVTNLGDESVYIKLSKVFLGEVENVNLQHRSPLYSIIMAGFMLIFKAPVLYKVIIVFQYILVAITAWLVYLLFRCLFLRKELAMIVALLFNLSFSTIFFANILLTEILTVFLLVLSVFLLLRVFDQCGLKRILALGTAIGLLSLARFNAIPLVVTFIALLGYILFRQKVSVKKWIYSMVVFIFSYALILNLWCLYNYQSNGFYGIFPGAALGIPKSPRNVTIASIRPGNIVSEENKSVLEIFLKAREEYLTKIAKIKAQKGSFTSLDKSGILNGLYSGYAIFGLASPALRAHFKLPDSASDSEVTLKLADFLKEISAQNNRFLWKFRFYSFLSGFRASVGGVLPIEYGNINLNILPAITFRIFKLIFVLISGFVFIAFFFFLMSTIKNKFEPDIPLLVMFFIIFSFWGINFVFFAVGDANRFKFPAEPLIIGLFVYYVCESINWLKNKEIFPLTSVKEK